MSAEEDRSSSVAVLVEDEMTGQKGVIHDGTHGVMVNRRIRCRDKVGMPGPCRRERSWRSVRESWCLLGALQRHTGGSSSWEKRVPGLQPDTVYVPSAQSPCS